jgi:hypothetical protein
MPTFYHYVLIGEDRAKVELEALSPLEAYSRISYAKVNPEPEVWNFLWSQVEGIPDERH